MTKVPSVEFLKSVLGDDGAEALRKANQRVPTLGAALAPRTIISWLTTAIRINYEGEIPGLDNSYIALQKSAGGFTGAMTLGDELFKFEGSDLIDVAAAVGVALGLDGLRIDPMLKTTDLSKLGKSIDMLVKARIIAETAAKEIEASREESSEESGEESSVDGIEKDELPGHANPPKGPKEPEAPKPADPTAPSTNKRAAPKPPGMAKKELVIKKSADHGCPECGLKQFKRNEFSGCMCFRALSKSVSTKVDGDYYVLTLNRSQWDDDAIQTLLSSFRG